MLSVVIVDGARVAYQMAGDGPAIVMIKNHRRPPDLAPVRMLADRFRVFQVHPIGFGASERPEEYEFGSIGEQVCAVLDHEEVDRFVVWGFSQTACMAALVARSTERAVALIAGGQSLIGIPTDGTMRRLEREPRLPVASLEFWRAYRGYDWHHELRAMTQPKLIYIGTADPGWRTFRKVTPVLRGCGCDCLEFDGLDHQTAGPGDDSELGGKTTAAAIMEWLERHHPNGW